MKKKQISVLRFFFALSDIFLLNVCLFISYYLSNKYQGTLDKSVYLDNVLPVNLIWFFSTTLFRLYSEYTVYKREDIYKATWRSVVFFSFSFQLYFLATMSFGFPGDYILTFNSFIIIGFLFSRYSFIAFEHVLNFNFNERKADVLAIASVGGHWIELLRLMPIFNTNDVTFISNKENLKDTLEGQKFYTVPDANRKNKFDLIICAASVLWFVLKIRPQVIITTGAAPGLIGICIGKLLGVKTIWIDSVANADKLSLSGYIALRIADRVYTQWEHLSTPRIVFSGNIF
jgi:hypothetical protein